MGPDFFPLALRPRLKCFREKFERKGVEACAYINNISPGLMGVTVDTIRANIFLLRELFNRQRRHRRQPRKHRGASIELALRKEISLSESVDVRIVEEMGVTMVGVPLCTEEHVPERAMSVRGGWRCEPP